MKSSNNSPFMNPYTDFGFKKLLGTEPNKDLLISFLNALFDGDRKTITDLRYLNTEVLGPYYGDRNSVFDVYCLTEDGGHFIVEMQRSDQPYFKDRTVYYASAAIVHQAPKGIWDFRLNEVCVVGILDFVFPNKEYPDDSYVHKVKLKDTDDNHEVYDKLTFYYVEMPKFKKTEDELVTMQDKWLFVLKNICYLLEQPKELQDQVFTKFFEEARIGMFTKEEQFAYMVSQKHYWDNHNTIAYSYEKGEKAGKEAGMKEGLKEGRELGLAEGKELGLAEGEKKAKLETAQKMLEMGIDIETIRKATGVNEKMIRN